MSDLERKAFNEIENGGLLSLYSYEYIFANREFNLALEVAIIGAKFRVWESIELNAESIKNTLTHN